MLTWLHRPLPPLRLALLTVGVALAVALYCIAYTALSGRGESFVEAIAWAGVNVLPWLFAFEAAKRLSGAWAKAGALAGGLAASLLLHAALHAGLADPGFELARRLPALLLVALLLASGGALARSRGRRPAPEADLFLSAEVADWIAAAGNYVELHGAGRTVILRASLAAVEARMARRGFVRIHRSTLVRRDRIARIRPGDVILADGTSLKVGKRYRAALTG